MNRPPRHSSVFVLVAAFGLTALASTAFAADATWNGVSYSGLNVATGANWVGSVAPGAASGTTNTDIATFNNAGSEAIAINGNYNLGGLTFASTGSTPNSYVFITGAPLLTDGGTIQTDATYRGIANFSAGLNIAGNATLTANGLAGSGLLIGALTNPASTTSTITLNGSNSGFNNYYGSLITGVISQGAGSTLTVTKSGTGSWYLGGVNTYTGGTNLNGGTLITNNAAALGSSGAITVQSDTRLRTMAALTDPSSRITINDGATLTLDTANVNQTWAGVLGNSGGSNTAGLTKTGLGTLTIAPAPGAVQTYKGTTTVNMGTLTISGASQTGNFTNLIDPGSALVLGGGSLNFTGKAGFTNSQTFNGTTLNAGISGFIPAAGTGTNTFDFGTITRNTGALLDITTASGYTINAGATGNDAGGLVRGVLINGDFAKSTAGTISAVSYTTQNAAGSWTSATSNYVTGAAVTGSVGTATINSLKLNNASSQNVSITGALSVNDGILFGSSIGANASTISGGILTGPSGGGSLIVVNNNAQNATGRNTISSVIKDYATSDFAGAGTDGTTNLILYSRATNGALVLSGANTYTGNTYIGGGANAQTGNMLTIVGVASGASIGSTGKTVYVNGGTGGSTNVLQVGNSDTFGDVKGTIQLDNGRLSLKRTDTYTISANVSGVGGGGYISQDSTGNATINFAAGNNAFTSLVNAAAGTLNLTGVGSVNTFASNLNGFNASATTNFNSGTYYLGSTGNTANQAGTLNINGATVITAGGRYFMNSGGILTLNSGTFQVNGNAMNGQAQTTGNITYNINGGQFITTQNNNTGSQSAWQLGGATAGATGSVIANQTAGEVSVGLPRNTNNPTNQFTALWIGGAGSIQTSTYNLSGGVLRVVGGIQESGTAGAVGAGGSNNFNWTGGRLTTSSINLNFITSNDGVNSGTGTLYQGGATSIMAPGETFQGVVYAGRTTIVGNYQIDNGSVAIGIGGTTAATAFHNTSNGTYDNLSVTGTTTLGGRFDVALNNGFIPSNASNFNVIVGTTAGATGNFTNQVTALGGNQRVVLADGLSSFLIATNTSGAATSVGGLTNVAARTTALGEFQATNTYNAADGDWDVAGAGSWTSFDPGATASPATQASGAIAQFADGPSTGTGATTVALNSTRNVQGVQFASAVAGHEYTITNGGTGSLILDNSSNKASATLNDTSANGNTNEISVPITLNSNLSATVTNLDSVLVLSGNVSGVGSTITKLGNGTLSLTGTNSYSGATIVSAGTLLVNGNNAAALGALTVASGATLAGTGTIGGATTILGSHNPGIFDAGIQTFNSDLTYSGGGAIVNWELSDNTVTNAANPSANFDSIVVGGNLNFAGLTTLNLATVPSAGGGTVSWSDPFWAADHTGTSGWLVFGVTGSTTNLGNLGVNFAGLKDSTGADFATSLAGSNFSLSQNGSNVYLNYSAVPEPGTLTLLIGGATAIMILRRRKRSAI